MNQAITGLCGLRSLAGRAVIIDRKFAGNAGALLGRASRLQVQVLLMAQAPQRRG
jgi:hypothetical protein